MPARTTTSSVKISALWASTLFVFAYVDLFSFYRADFRADVEAGEVGGFAVNQSFLLGTTAYVVIPSLMVFGALVLGPRVNRIANIALGIVYAVAMIARPYPALAGLTGGSRSVASSDAEGLGVTPRR